MPHVPVVETSQIINPADTEIEQKFYHERVVAKTVLARSKRVHLHLDEVGLFDSDGMWELCMEKKILPCQRVNKQSVRLVLAKEVRKCQQFQETNKI